jgi:hypothetical protein
VDPELLRAGFRLGVLILALALITLPFQNRSSAEFVVTVLAAVVGLAFTLGVGILARRAAPPLPSGDKRRSNHYNGSDSRRGKT